MVPGLRGVERSAVSRSHGGRGRSPLATCARRFVLHLSRDATGGECRRQQIEGREQRDQGDGDGRDPTQKNLGLHAVVRPGGAAFEAGSAIAEGVRWRSRRPRARRSSHPRSGSGPSGRCRWSPFRRPWSRTLPTSSHCPPSRTRCDSSTVASYRNRKRSAFHHRERGRVHHYRSTHTGSDRSSRREADSAGRGTPRRMQSRLRRRRRRGGGVEGVVSSWEEGALRAGGSKRSRRLPPPPLSRVNGHPGTPGAASQDRADPCASRALGQVPASPGALAGHRCVHRPGMEREGLPRS